MTRHGPNHTRAAALVLRPTVRPARGTGNTDLTGGFDHYRGSNGRRTAHQTRSETARHTRRGIAATIPTATRNANFP